MTAQRLDGLATARAMEELTQRVSALREAGVVPGWRPCWWATTRQPELRAHEARDCEQVGIESIQVELPADATPSQVEEALVA